MSNQIQCPNCGSFRTFPFDENGMRRAPTFKDLIEGVEGFVGLLTNAPMGFENPKNIKKFERGLTGAKCQDCQFKFDFSTSTKSISMPYSNAVSKNNVEERLAHLEQLRNKKLITDEEYKLKREEIIRNL